MSGEKNLHRRRLLRLQEYDYSQAGAYFVTLCTEGHRYLFGEIVDGTMQLNDAGKIVAEAWQWLGSQYAHVELGEWIIMPNHMHGIIVLVDAGDVTCGSCRGGSRTAPTNSRRKPIGGLIGAFKTVSTKRINEWRQTPAVKLWQRNYWEHVVRNEHDLTEIREYIVNNPVQWKSGSSLLRVGKGMRNVY